MSDDETEYLPEDLRNAETLDFIRTHPKMFFGVENPTEAHLTRGMLSGVVLLTDRPVVTYRHDGWRVVVAAEDWLSLAIIPDGRDVFTQSVYFPEMGVNACHPEVALAAFANDVVTATKDGVIVVRGGLFDDDVLARAGDCLPNWRRLVAFRM